MFKFYTFGLWFNYNHWVGVCYFIPSVCVSFISVGSGFSIKNMNFSFLGANIPILFVGSQSMSVEVRIIWYQSQGSKIRFKILLSFVSCDHLILFRLCSLFLILVIILSCSVCIHCSLFLFCFVHQVKVFFKKKKEKKKRCYWSNIYYHSLYLSKLIFSWIVTFVVSVSLKTNMIFVLFLWFIVSIIFSCRQYWIKYYKLNFLIKFISLIKNWKRETTSGKRQKSVRLILRKSEVKSKTQVWVT
jgi:hypothetical protein